MKAFMMKIVKKKIVNFNKFVYNLKLLFIIQVVQPVHLDKFPGIIIIRKNDYFIFIFFKKRLLQIF